MFYSIFRGPVSVLVMSLFIILYYLFYSIFRGPVSVLLMSLFIILSYLFYSIFRGPISVLVLSLFIIFLICFILFLSRCTQYNITCDQVCQWLATDRWFSPGTPVSSTNKTNRHDNWNIVERGVKSVCSIKYTLA